MSHPSTSPFTFGSGVVRGEKFEPMIEALCEEALGSLSGRSVDLAFFFMTPHFRSSSESIQEKLQEKLQAHVLLGCTAVSVIGRDQEVEAESAMSLWVAHLGGVKKFPFYLRQSDLASFKNPESVRNYFGAGSGETPAFFVLPDPFSFDVGYFLEAIGQVFPGSPVIGGMASGAGEPGENRLFSSEGIFTEGAVGVMLSGGGLNVRTLVSQGCRPFGEPVVVTEAQENVILTLAGKSAIEFLEDTYRRASARDQVLARSALFIGSVVDEYKQHPERGDFVIRSVVGMDRNLGALAVSDYVQVGETVQFHVRDAESAHEDLVTLCEHQKSAVPDPKAALIFSCNGRGSGMFKTRHHDIMTVQSTLGKLPAAGFFCAGELGPIGKKNFMHSFTASLALFYEGVESRK